jgi:hypothetical protein
MVATHVVVLSVNNHWFAAHEAPKLALKPIGHIDLMAPTADAGLALLLGFLGLGYLVCHKGHSNASLSQD